MTVRQCCGRITAVQMDNLRGLLDIRRMNKAKNARIRELCVVTKEVVEERIDEGALWWFGYVERMENDRIAKRVYVGECVGSCSVGRQRKRWNDACVLEWFSPNARISELCGVSKRVNEWKDEIVLEWFGHIERVENDRIAKWVYVGECVCNRFVGGRL